MNYESAKSHINSVIDEYLPEPIAERLMNDDAFFQKHYDGLVHAVSVADPNGENSEAEWQATHDYAEVIMADIQARFPKDFIDDTD